MPKNSPSATSNEASRTAWSTSWLDDAKGWRTRSFSVLTRRWGRRKVFVTPFTDSAGAVSVVAPAAPRRSAVIGTGLTLAADVPRAAGDQRVRRPPREPARGGARGGIRGRTVARAAPLA